LLITATILLWLSFYTAEEYASMTAISLFFAIFVITLEDISTDALAVKELKDPEKASFLQSILYDVGSIVGGLAFMKLISKPFA
jgi:hypothetical protein